MRPGHIRFLVTKRLQKALTFVSNQSNYSINITVWKQQQQRRRTNCAEAAKKQHRSTAKTADKQRSSRSSSTQTAQAAQKQHKTAQKQHTTSSRRAAANKRQQQRRGSSSSGGGSSSSRRSSQAVAAANSFLPTPCFRECLHGAYAKIGLLLTQTAYAVCSTILCSNYVVRKRRCWSKNVPTQNCLHKSFNTHVCKMLTRRPLCPKQNSLCNCSTVPSLYKPSHL